MARPLYSLMTGDRMVLVEVFIGEDVPQAADDLADKAVIVTVWKGEAQETRIAARRDEIRKLPRYCSWPPGSRRT